MNVEQCMTRQPKTCTSKDNLACAAQIMWENDCGFVPVIDGGSRLVGVITDRDVCMAAYTKGAPLHALEVSAAMAKKVYTCRPHDALEAAERLMQTYQVRRLPVVDGEARIIGVLSLNDVARAMRAAFDTTSAKPLVQELALTLAAISEPRRRGEGTPAVSSSVRESAPAAGVRPARVGGLITDAKPAVTDKKPAGRVEPDRPSPDRPSPDRPSAGTRRRDSR